MILILLSLISGCLTIFAPCALPMLPIIVGGSLKKDEHPRRRALIISFSLAGSIFIFSLLIKFSSLTLNLQPSFWAGLSGIILIMLGIFNLFPNLWMNLAAGLKLRSGSDAGLAKSYGNNYKLEPILTGIALGPVFSGCNPIYLFILSVLLPRKLGFGIINLLAYCLGLSVTLFAISIGGQKLIAKLKWATKPSGWFKRGLAVLFIVFGILIFSGADKKIEAWALQNNNWFGRYLILEQRLVDSNR